MIRVGPLSRARLRAACLALRVRWVEDLEQRIDVALATARGYKVDRDQMEIELQQARRERTEARLGRDEALAKLERTQRSYDVTSRAYGAASCDLVAVDRKRAEAESERGRADLELREVRDVLAPDLDPGDTPLADVARAALASARATAVAVELRWWAARTWRGGGSASPDDLARRAEVLDPAGTTPTGFRPPTASIFRGLTDDEVAADSLPREACDPAMGGDIEPPPGRPA